jgi:hypothetical protein
VRRRVSRRRAAAIAVGGSRFAQRRCAGRWWKAINMEAGKLMRKL